MDMHEAEIASAEGTDTPPAAYLICHGDEDFPGCGSVPLTADQYLRQLEHPDYPWKCPKCRRDADYDDELSERVQGVSETRATDPTSLAPTKDP